MKLTEVVLDEEGKSFVFDRNKAKAEMKQRGVKILSSKEYFGLCTGEEVNLTPIGKPLVVMYPVDEEELFKFKDTCDRFLQELENRIHSCLEEIFFSRSRSEFSKIKRTLHLTAQYSAFDIKDNTTIETYAVQLYKSKGE